MVIMFDKRIKRSEDSRGHHPTAGVQRQNKPRTHLCPPVCRPVIRVHGDVRRINVDALDHKTGARHGVRHHERRAAKTYEEFLVDFSFRDRGLARFRVNAFNQNRGAAAVFRTIPSKILTLEQLNAPRSSATWRSKPRGLVLVTGPTGSSKSTTLAAHGQPPQRNRIRPHPHGGRPDRVRARSEVPDQPARSGPDDAVVRGLRSKSALRGPDAILVGEMRDLKPFAWP